MKPATLRTKLLRMHAAAESAIVPGIDYAAWFDQHAGPVIVLRIDQAAAAIEAGESVIPYAKLRAEFYPREDVLIARVWAAAHPTDARAQVALAIELARAAHPHRDIPSISYWSNQAIEHVASGGTSIHGVSL